MADEPRCPSCLGADWLLLGKVFRPERRWWLRWAKVRRDSGSFVACARCHTQYVVSPAGVYEPQPGREAPSAAKSSTNGGQNVVPMRSQRMMAPEDEPWAG